MYNLYIEIALKVNDDLYKKGIIDCDQYIEKETHLLNEFK